MQDISHNIKSKRDFRHLPTVQSKKHQQGAKLVWSQSPLGGKPQASGERNMAQKDKTSPSQGHINLDSFTKERAG